MLDSLLSIKMEEFSVTLAGGAIDGISLFDNICSRNLFIYLFFWHDLEGEGHMVWHDLKLKSPAGTVF